MLVEHTTKGKITDRRDWAIGIVITADGTDTWGHKESAKFSREFLEQTETLYRLRAPLFYPKSVFEKITEFFLTPSPNHKNPFDKEEKGPGKNSAPHR